MKLLCSVVFIVFFAGFAASQSEKSLDEISELRKRNASLEEAIGKLAERAEELQTRLSQVPRADREKAASLGAMVVRLDDGNSAGGLADEFTNFASAISLRAPGDGDQYDATGLDYDDGKFSSDGRNGHLFIMSLGDVPLEKVNESTPQFKALAKYVPAAEPGKVSPTFESDGFTFRSEIEAVPRSTFIFRAIGYASDSRLDAIYAIRVARRDSDGSIVVFYKRLKIFPAPKFDTDPIFTRTEITETGISVVVAERLRDAGLSQVSLEFKEDRQLSVKGTVRDDEAPKIVAIVSEVAESYKVSNELKIR